MGKYDRLIKRIAGSVDYWAQAAMRRFVLEIDRRMEAQGISRALLAEKLGSSPAYVTKVMRGDVNFTLETMTKLALAVGGKLHIEVVDSDIKWRPIEWRSERPVQVAARVQTKTIELPLHEAPANQPQYEKVTRHAA